MEYTNEQLARIWLQSAPMSAWSRLNQLKEIHGSALGVWDHFSPALFDALGESTFSLPCTRRLVPPGQAGRQLSPDLESPESGPKQDLYGSREGGCTGHHLHPRG